MELNTTVKSNSTRPRLSVRRSEVECEKIVEKMDAHAVNAISRRKCATNGHRGSDKRKHKRKTVGKVPKPTYHQCGRQVPEHWAADACPEFCTVDWLPWNSTGTLAAATFRLRFEARSPQKRKQPSISNLEVHRYAVQLATLHQNRRRNQSQESKQVGPGGH